MEKIEEGGGVLLDPETEFLVSKRETGNEWELYKENVRPLKRGRKVSILNDALKSHTHHLLKKSLLDHRRFLLPSLHPSIPLSLSVDIYYIYIYP